MIKMTANVLQATFQNRQTWWDPTASPSPKPLPQAILSRFGLPPIPTHPPAGGIRQQQQQQQLSFHEEDLNEAAFMDIDFRTAALSLAIMQGNSNLHLAFHAREAKVRPVPPSLRGRGCSS